MRWTRPVVMFVGAAVLLTTVLLSEGLGPDEAIVPRPGETGEIAALVERGVRFDPNAVLVWNAPVIASGESAIEWPFEGLASSRAHVKVLAVFGVLLPAERGTPLSELDHELVHTQPERTPTLRVQLPAPVPEDRRMHVSVLFETESLHVRRDEAGRHLFRIPRYPQNIQYYLPPDHAVVSCDLPLRIDERDGRTALMNENLTNQMSIDSFGDTILVKTRLLARAR